MVQKYQALVYTVCHQLVPDVQEAQDLTQETFLAAWRAIDRPSHKNRTIRPLSGNLWPQWRCAHAGHCRAFGVRLL